MTEVICTNAAFSLAGYPNKFHGNPISGKRPRINSNVTQTNGAPRHANVRLRFDNCRTTQANDPVKIPHAAAISTNSAQPPARETPPCRYTTVANHGTDKSTNAMACKNPQT